jgi:hypothetical protein
MRPGVIIAIVVAIAVVIGGIVWYNNYTEQTQLRELEQQQAEQAAQAEREAEEAAAAEQAAREAEEAEALAAEEAAAEEDAAMPEDTAAEPGADQAITDEDAIVVGDEITEDTTVVQSATDEPVILDADESASTVEFVDEPDGAEETGDPSATEGTTGTAATTDPAPEELLTPENFDRDQVLALIEDSDDLTAEQRSSLRALVEGSSANPDMVDAAIESIREALDLPPLE